MAFSDGAVDARHEVANLMDRLTAEERELISLLYGLNGVPLEMGEVAARVKRQLDIHLTFDGGATHFAIALRRMGVADREQRALDLDGEVERRALG